MEYIAIGLFLVVVILSIKLYKKNKEAIPELKPFENDAINEQFLKYVSDSRDWAYTYIEDVQKSLLYIEQDLKPIIEFWDEQQSLKSLEQVRIKKIYQKIVELLPKEN